MAQNSTREEIVRKGADLIHAQGFNATGIQQILDAAGIPKGSFYFYFKSKEDFGLTVIDYFRKFIQGMGDKYLQDAGIPPLKKLSRYFDAYYDHFEKMDLCRGCPIGNLTQEMSDLSEAFRAKIGEVYSGMQGCIEQLLTEARESGDISPDTDLAQVSQFIINSWEGAIMHMKLVKDTEPLMVFKNMIFERILK
jgi:TetR/AcrR family transcriptional repressor of nem operon